MYDLLKTKLIKKLDTGLREASSIAVHPGGMIIVVMQTSHNIQFSSSHKRKLFIMIICLYTLLIGDNLIVGSKEGKMCWFDMDLSTKPYKILK